MNADELISERLTALPEVGFALLFGSRAQETGRPDSDVDVAVFLSPRLTGDERWRLLLRLQATLAHLGDVDVVVLNDAPPLLAHRALCGKRLFVRDREAYVRFAIRTIAIAEDERYFRELHRRTRQQRLEEGRFGRP